VAGGLRESAAAFLARQHATGEPITWEPPAELLDGLSLPGTDPGTIDLGQLHQLIRRDHLGLTAAARRLGTTRAVIDLLLDHDPAPETAIPPATAKHPRRIPSHEEFAACYCDENLSLAKSAVRRWVKIYRLPAQGTRFPIRMDIAAATAGAPPVLRPAITGPGAWKRLSRLAAASSYSSLRQAAASLGIEHSVLISRSTALNANSATACSTGRPASRPCSRPPTARRSSPPYAQPAPPGPLTTSARAAQGKCHKTETQPAFRSGRIPASEQVAPARHAIRTETLQRVISGPS
jgi:hypothetical protein